MVVWIWDNIKFDTQKVDSLIEQSDTEDKPRDCAFAVMGTGGSKNENFFSSLIDHSDANFFPLNSGHMNVT